VQHIIKVMKDTSVAAPLYRVPHYLKQIEKEEIDRMLRDNLISISDSEWTSPVLLVKKKDNTFRFCVDYRKLNEITIPDKYPIPRIDETLTLLSGMKFFTILDLKSGYWQLSMHPNSRKYTAFLSNFGKYSWNVMPFGLKNAPSTFQRMMDKIFSKEILNFILLYLDDIIIYSRTWKEHIEHLKCVFNRLSEHNLQINIQKCKFGRSEVKYLGHIISINGITPDIEKIDAIKSMKTPNNIKQLQSFLGSINFYRGYIKNFAQIAQPLYILLKTKKKSTWFWHSKQEKAFNILKNELIKEPILRHPNFNKEFYIQTDASDLGLGAVLLQYGTNNESDILFPLAYASRSLNSAEHNYATIEKECIGIVFALEKFKYIIFGYTINILSDHKPLKWLFKQRKNGNARLLRWITKMEDYNIKSIEYLKGKTNYLPDLLSRNPNEKSLTVLSTCQIPEFQLLLLSSHSNLKQYKNTVKNSNLGYYTEMFNHLKSHKILTLIPIIM
jgi:hypothetical protein